MITNELSAAGESRVTEGPAGFTKTQHRSHRDVTKRAQGGVMQFKTSGLEATSSSLSPDTFRSPPHLAESRSDDWRPGYISHRRQPAKKLNCFLRAQRDKLLDLRDALVGSINGPARETRLAQVDSSAFATHNGDAGSDACDRDLVLCLLSQETDALLEIDAALARIELGKYGICEMSGRPIPVARLRAIPFARYTVEFQEKIEKQRKIVFNRRGFPEIAALFDSATSDE